MIVAILLLVVGFLALVKGADWFVDGAATLASKFGIPQLVVGLTIVAMGTSLPEAAVSITSGIKGNAGITIGNIVGSNILNILIILGITAVITNVRIQMSTLRYEIPFMLLITVGLLFMGMGDGQIVAFEGIILWLFFIIYLIYLFKLTKKSNVKDEESTLRDLTVFQCICYGVLGMILVVAGSNLVVNGATDIAQSLGMSERFIGLTIVAFGTSLPELVTSVCAALKGNSGIAIGNIVGSNIFNILFVIGTVALICPVPFEQKFVFDVVVAILSGVLLLAGTIRHKELRRGFGVVLLISYAAYFIYLL